MDDLIFTENNPKMFDEFKLSMKQEFDMTDLGKMKYFLGVEVHQGDGGIFIHQQKYANEILERFRMTECKPVNVPIVPGTKISKQGEGRTIDSIEYKRLVGSLMYLTATTPDLAFAVSMISRFMETPTEQHLAAGKRILRYIRGTLGYGIYYKRQQIPELTAFFYSDYAGDYHDRKSTSGHVVLLGTGAVSWGAKK